MTGKKEIITQTQLAFEFIQKLYLEVSYLIKEIEGTLFEEEEKFSICRPSGYGVTARGSTGLESVYVNMWLMRKLAVAFIPEIFTDMERGQTHTEISKDLRVLYVRVVLDDATVDQPKLFTGYFTDFVVNKAGERLRNRFENMMSHITYNDQKIFHDPQAIEYEDAYFKFNGKFIETNLYDISDSKALSEKVITPTLALYRGK